MTRLLALALGLAPFASLAPRASGQVGGGTPGTSREAMWPAPTAEDWARPCLITWQRTYEDALAVARETGRAILVCVNMDGEIASEHYAGIRYRQPEIAALYLPYVNVIASVYRHTPRDHDEQGRRILCPRFGGVTCGEHIAIEPGLFEGFFEGQRVAPRHIGVELDGKEMYDVYYAFDTDSVFAAIREGIENRETVPENIARGDRSLRERVDSRHNDDRTEVEAAYITGDRDLRRSLLEAAMAVGEDVSVDLLRLALFGFDLELSRLARRALAQSSSESAIDLIAEALRVPMEDGERDALIAALARLGDSWPRARTLAVVHRGLAAETGAVDVEGWSRALEGRETPGPARDRYEIESRLDGTAEASQARPDDAGVQLELAEASLALAVDPRNALALGTRSRTASRYARLMFEDARRAAVRAEELGASGWRVDAAVALADYYLGNVEAARARAERAVAAMPAGEEGWNAMAVLAVFAEARREAIAAAVRAKTDWPAQWLTDVHAAYSVLARHPLGSDVLIVAHYDFLRMLGARGQAARVLDEGLGRFPQSWTLHDRQRGRILEERGIAGLEPAYEEMLAAEGAAPNLEWFAGYASLVAAEFHRRAGRDEQALGAYDRAVDHYERGIQANPDSREAADHYVAVAMAGRARLALARGEHEIALAQVLASFERRPEAAASLDGLGLSAVGTAKMLLARLEALERADLAARLQAALDALDPELLKLPEFERGGPDAPRGEGGRRRRGRRNR